MRCDGEIGYKARPLEKVGDVDVRLLEDFDPLLQAAIGANGEGSREARQLLVVDRPARVVQDHRLDAEQRAGIERIVVQRHGRAAFAQPPGIETHAHRRPPAPPRPC